MKTALGLFALLLCRNASATLTLTIDNPNRTELPGGHAVYAGTLHNTDTVAYTVVNFSLVNPPTDATGPPTGNQLFPIAEPAVPFTIAAGGKFSGVVLDITVPATAHMGSHTFAVGAVTSSHAATGNSIASNYVSLQLSVAAPEPTTAVIKAVAEATVIDAAGRNVGNIVGALGNPVSVMISVAGRVFQLNVRKDGLSGVGQGLVFATPDCSGTPYLLVQDPVGILVEQASVASPGKTLYAAEPGAVPRFVALASNLITVPSPVPPICIPFPPQPPPGVPPPGPISVVPAVKLADLNLFFTPPFSVRVKTPEE